MGFTILSIAIGASILWIGNISYSFRDQLIMAITGFFLGFIFKDIK